VTTTTTKSPFLKSRADFEWQRKVNRHKLAKVSATNAAKAVGRFARAVAAR
jgi:hypothetical protein